MLNDKIEFHGKILSMRAISLEIGISRDTLQKHYDRTGDIYESEKICRYILAQKRDSLVKYNGEMLTMYAIAKKNGLKHDTLKRKYENLGDIYQAVESCLKLKEKTEEAKLEYNEEKLTLNEIGLVYGCLKQAIDLNFLVN